MIFSAVHAWNVARSKQQPMGCGASTGSKYITVEAVSPVLSASYDDRKAGTLLEPIYKRDASIDAQIDAALAHDDLTASIAEMEARLKGRGRAGGDGETHLSWRRPARRDLPGVSRAED